MSNSELSDNANLRFREFDRLLTQAVNAAEWPKLQKNTVTWHCMGREWIENGWIIEHEFGVIVEVAVVANPNMDEGDWSIHDWAERDADNQAIYVAVSINGLCGSTLVPLVVRPATDDKLTKLREVADTLLSGKVAPRLVWMPRIAENSSVIQRFTGKSASRFFWPRWIFFTGSDGKSKLKVRLNKNNSPLTHVA